MAGYLAGVDIGGTKCAVCIGLMDETGIQVIGKRRFPTPGTPQAALKAIEDSLDSLLSELSHPTPQAIGISCGGPLDSQRGWVLSPPNLPGWDQVDVVSPLKERFKVPVSLQNDANACALAEWKWGAGRGCRNMIFLTFGTGMGAGLILDGRLYSGTNDLAGEVGHIRLEPGGPTGYGKAGSFEGFCSGGGIAQLAKSIAVERIHAGLPCGYCPRIEDVSMITAEKVGAAAQKSDEAALQVFEIVGRHLGQGLAILIDILNPERIVIGSIYGRQRSILEPITMRVLEQEALQIALSVCSIVPAGLGESVGDLAGLSVALNTLYG
ncbi:MAG: ROK family protein [Omnitrophica WOR_2 bacterium]